MFKTLHLCFSLISRQALLAAHRHFYLWSGNFILRMPSVLSQLSQCRMKAACVGYPSRALTLGRRQLNTTHSGVHSCTDQYCHSFSLFPDFPLPSSFSCLRNGGFGQMGWILFLLWTRSGAPKPPLELLHTAGLQGMNTSPEKLREGLTLSSCLVHRAHARPVWHCSFRVQDKGASDAGPEQRDKFQTRGECLI